MLTFAFAMWSAARALGWASTTAPLSPEAEEPPVLPRLRSARASSDLSTLSATTTSSSQTSSGDHSKRSMPLSPTIHIRHIALVTHYSYEFVALSIEQWEVRNANLFCLVLSPSN